MSSLDFPTTQPTGRRLDEKRPSRLTEIRGHKLEDEVWERKDRSVPVGTLHGGRVVVKPRPEYDAEGVRIG
jgi:hypothetical protein